MYHFLTCHYCLSNLLFKINVLNQSKLHLKNNQRQEMGWFRIYDINFEIDIKLIKIYFIHMLLRSLIFLSLLLALCTSQEEENTQKQQILRTEHKIKDDNNMTFTNIKSFTFPCGRFDQFVLKPSVSKEMKFEIHIYWKKDNVYMSSEYEKGEEIRIIAIQNDERILLDREFYVTTGFTLNVKEGLTYKLRFLGAGKIDKLVAMIYSSPMEMHDDIAKKQHIDGAQQQIQKIGNEIKALQSISQRNYLIKQKLGSKILQNTRIYMGYEVFEVILIIGVSVLQVSTLTKMLKGGSIV